MDTIINEINEEVVNTTEEIVTTSSGKGFAIVAGVGLTVLSGVIAYKYVVKPMLEKIKTKKEQVKACKEMCNEIDSEDEAES